QCPACAHSRRARRPTWRCGTRALRGRTRPPRPQYTATTRSATSWSYGSPSLGAKTEHALPGFIHVPDQRVHLVRHAGFALDAEYALAGRLIDERSVFVFMQRGEHVAGKHLLQWHVQRFGRGGRGPGIDPFAAHDPARLAAVGA